MPQNTIGTYLMYKDGTASQWTKLVDIVSYPSVGGTPNMLDGTDLSHDTEVLIAGIKRIGNAPTFEANYSLEAYERVLALEGKLIDLAIWYGGDIENDKPTGEHGKFAGKGTVQVTSEGGGVDDIRKMTISTSMTKPYKLDKAA